MIDAQKVAQRLADLDQAQVPVTNYGMFFSFAATPEALRRALEPWGVESPQPLHSRPNAAPLASPCSNSGANCHGKANVGN